MTGKNNGGGRVVNHPLAPSHTAASIRDEKLRARAAFEQRLDALRPSLWKLLTADPSKDPAAYANACNAVNLGSIGLDRLVREAAYGCRQASYMQDLSYEKYEEEAEGDSPGAKAAAHLVATARRRRASLPAGWKPSRDDEATADHVNASDRAARGAAVRMAPIGSRWMNGSGLCATVVRHTPSGDVRCRFDRDGRETNFGLRDFELGVWFTRLDPEPAASRGKRSRRALRIVRGAP